MLKPKKHYLTAEELQEEYDKSLLFGEPTSKLLEMFEKIARNSYKIFKREKVNSTTNHQDDEAIINYAISEAWRKWRKYDPRVTKNIFSFFTTVILNDCRTHYNKLRQHKNKHISIDAIFQNNNQ